MFYHLVKFLAIVYYVQSYAWAYFLAVILLQWLVIRYAIFNLEVIQAAISIAKQEGLLVSLDLASFEVGIFIPAGVKSVKERATIGLLNDLSMSSINAKNWSVLVQIFPHEV